ESACQDIRSFSTSTSFSRFPHHHIYCVSFPLPRHTLRVLYFLSTLPSLFICNEVQAGKKTRAWIRGRFMENLPISFQFSISRNVFSTTFSFLSSLISYLPVFLTSHDGVPLFLYSLFFSFCFIS
ncbi:hypothetical protein H102_05331, partial [Trichophyton rubrum CBS 100081]